MKKKICLITPSHISSNPRLVKEASALSANDYPVHIVFAQYKEYLSVYDNLILSRHPEWTFDVVDFTGRNLLSKGRRTALLALRKFVKYITNGRTFGYLIANPNFYSQAKKASASKAEIFIAHNLGALPVAIWAAKKNQGKCVFDAEDFHRNEISDVPDHPDVILSISLENRYLPSVHHMTAASPLISEQYSRLYRVPVHTILNVFPKSPPYTFMNNAGSPLRLFWFSQTIGHGRGLETIIAAVLQTDIQIELHLMGEVAADYQKTLEKKTGDSCCRLFFHSPGSQEELFDIARTFDIGLAAELRQPFNRDICLTNKIFTYVRCGLAVAASATVAQKHFLSKYPKIGRFYEDTSGLANILTAYNFNRASLLDAKINSFQTGQQELNWETECKKFLAGIAGL